MQKRKSINEFWFWILSLFWGYWMTIAGGIAFVILYLKGYVPEKYNYSYVFHLSDNKGGWGLTLGPVIIFSGRTNENLKQHEFGHSLQNCYFGPYMVWISLFSIIRFWFRDFISKDISEIPNLLKPFKELFIAIDYELPSYDSIWFEGTATYLGSNFIKPDYY